MTDCLNGDGPEHSRDIVVLPTVLCAAGRLTVDLV